MDHNSLYPSDLYPSLGLHHYPAVDHHHPVKPENSFSSSHSQLIGSQPPWYLASQTHPQQLQEPSPPLPPHGACFSSDSHFVSHASKSCYSQQPAWSSDSDHPPTSYSSQQQQQQQQQHDYYSALDSPSSTSTSAFHYRDRSRSSSPPQHALLHQDPGSVPTFRTLSPDPLSRSVTPESNAQSSPSGSPGKGSSGRPRKLSEASRRMRVAALNESPKATAAHYLQQQYRCDECGKTYKHPNCLSKHRWEHSEHWAMASKFLLSKHQQVQLMEAAAILVAMDTANRRTDVDAGKRKMMVA